MNRIERTLNALCLRAASLYGGLCLRHFLRLSARADVVNTRLLHRLLRKNRDTEFGRSHGFDRIRSVEDYRLAVPFTEYADYRGAVERMAAEGEQGLLTEEPVRFLARTSGTAGAVKRIPVVPSSYRPYFRCEAIFFHIGVRWVRKTAPCWGRGLNTVEAESLITPGGIREGFISAYAIGRIRHLLAAIGCIPAAVYGYGDGVDMKYIKARYALADRDLLFMMSVFMSTLTDLMSYIEENSELLLRDIATGAIDGSIALPPELRRRLERGLRPDPKRAADLREVFACPSEEPLIRRIWPRMRVILAIGTGEFAPFTEKMRSLCGPEVRFCYEMYAASESLIGSVIEMESPDYLLIPDSSFYEFLPVGDESARPLLLHDLKVGGLYEIVLTTRSGLYRYRIRDVVRVTGHVGKCPLIRFAYRKNQLINVTGVKLTSEQITAAIRRFEDVSGLSVTDYSLCPDTGSAPWRLSVYLEPDGALPEGGERLPELLDETLSLENAEYGRMLRIGEVAPCAVSVVAKGTYSRYRSAKVRDCGSANQLKAVRILDNPEKQRFFEDAVIRRFR